MMEDIDYGRNNVYVFEFQVDNVRLKESPLMQKLKLIKEEDMKEKVEVEDEGDEEGGPPEDVEKDAQFFTSKKENVQFEMHGMVKPNKEVDDKAEEKLANKFQSEKQIEGAIDKALGTFEVVDYNEEDDDDDENKEFGETDDLDEFYRPDAEPADINAKNLKVTMSLYNITEFEIVEENFVENINRLIAEKDGNGMASASLASSILTANYSAQAGLLKSPAKSPVVSLTAAVSSEIEELKKKSFCRITAATTPAKMIRKIKRKPLLLRLYLEQPHRPKPLKLIGVGELKLDQSFIYTIITANTSSVVPQSVSTEETLPIINGLEEHVADVKILFRLASFGRIPWPECPDTLLTNKASECTVIMCKESDDSDVYLPIEDQ